MNTTPPRGVPIALFLTISLKLRSSYIVKTKAFRKRLLYVCVPPYLITQGLSALARTNAKIGIISKAQKFSGENYIEKIHSNTIMGCGGAIPLFCSNGFYASSYRHLRDKGIIPMGVKELFGHLVEDIGTARRNYRSGRKGRFL